MDSDDLYPNKFTLQLLYSKAIKNKAYICGGGLKMFHEKGIALFYQNQYFFLKRRV